ncbi:MAG: 4-alpha-glucanotransferase, partial [Pyrinomonadaceae bacterium]
QPLAEVLPFVDVSDESQPAHGRRITLTNSTGAGRVIEQTRSPIPSVDGSGGFVWVFRDVTDAVRLDHFIGFVRNWEVPGGDKTAENGSWASVPGREFFTMLRSRIGHLPVIAEDLGSLTAEVEVLRDEFGFPGMRILQYAFGGDAFNRDLPHNYPQNCVAYTGTHDNDTIAGWYASAPKNVKTHCRKYLEITGKNIHWDLIRAALASVADTTIIPAQDLLGLGTGSRMNTPATASGNWEWRLKDGQLTDEVCEKLLDLTVTFGRTHSRES